MFYSCINICRGSRKLFEPEAASHETIMGKRKKVLCLIFTGHLKKCPGFVYAELQINRLKPKTNIQILTEKCVGCGTQNI